MSERTLEQILAHFYWVHHIFNGRDGTGYTLYRPHYDVVVRYPESKSYIVEVAISDKPKSSVYLTFADGAVWIEGQDPFVEGVEISKLNRVI